MRIFVIELLFNCPNGIFSPTMTNGQKNVMTWQSVFNVRMLGSKSNWVKNSEFKVTIL